MSETPKEQEPSPNLRFGQVVEVSYHDGPSRSVVMQIVGDEALNSKIVNEGTPEESLAMYGSCPINSLVSVTEEFWPEDRIRQGLANKFGLAPDSDAIVRIVEDSRQSFTDQ